MIASGHTRCCATHAAPLRRQTQPIIRLYLRWCAPLVSWPTLCAPTDHELAKSTRRPLSRCASITPLRRAHSLLFSLLLLAALQIFFRCHWPPAPMSSQCVCVCVCQRHTGRRRAGSNLCLPSSSASILAPRAQNTVHLLAAPEQRQQSRAQTALSYSLLATKAGPDANELDKLLDTNIMRDLALSPPLDARQQPNRLSE